MVEFLKRMQDEIQFCVQKSYEEITEPVKQETAVKQGCSLGPYLFNIFTNGNIACISEEKPMHKQWKRKLYKHYWLLMLWQPDQFPSLVY